MPKYGFVVVEGPHDAECVRALLRPYGFSRVQMLDKVDTNYRKLVPTRYPQDGDLHKRMETPVFLKCDTHFVSIHTAIGESRLAQTVHDNVRLLGMDMLVGVAVVLDADTDENITAEKRYLILREKLGVFGYAIDPIPGTVTHGQPNFGAYVLPDNSASGTLEDILLECASIVYPNLLVSADTHVKAALADTTLDNHDRLDILKPAGRNKSVVGTIASILRPGKSVQVSIQDNRWFSLPCLSLARVHAIKDFLAKVLALH